MEFFVSAEYFVVQVKNFAAKFFAVKEGRRKSLESARVPEIGRNFGDWVEICLLWCEGKEGQFIIIEL